MFNFFTSTPVPPPSSPPDPAKLALRPEECQTLTLPDGRDIGYAAYGSTTLTDPVIFLFHGLPGCRITGRSFDAICARIPTRLIAMDRPGCGLSTLAARTLVDWPSDVLAVADHLGIETFSVLGASGGCAYALACARFLPNERLRGTSVVCGIGPVAALLDTVPYMPPRLLGLTPWVLRLVARCVVLPMLMAPYQERDAARLKRVLEDQAITPEEKRQMSEGDGSGTTLDDVVAGLMETFRQGVGGSYLDGAVLSSEWGFELGDVERERKVWMWHGDQDQTAPVGVARWMDERLGGGRLRVLEGKTHFTIWKEHSEEIFRQCAGA